MTTENFAFEEQKVMERRYHVPYNWCLKKSSRHWRAKHGLWTIAAKLAAPFTGKVVLDGGCGDGWYSAKISEQGAKAIGLDYSERSIDFAKLLVADATFHVGSLTKIPLPDNSVDTIISIQVLEHLPLPEVPHAVAELARVLKKDGAFVISVPSTVRKMSTAHFQHFTPESLTQTLSSHFTIEKMVGQEYRTPLLFLIERALENRLWSLPRIAYRFNIGPFMRFWNETDAHKGQNLVARCVKK